MPRLCHVPMHMHILWFFCLRIGSNAIIQRDRFANLEKAKPKEYFDIPNLERICKSVRSHSPRQAVCSKEIRFLEHTKQVVDAAQRLGIPLTLLYLIRDPRAVVISQLWNYPKLRFKKDKDLRVMGKQLIQEHCRCLSRYMLADLLMSLIHSLLMHILPCICFYHVYVDIYVRCSKSHRGMWQCVTMLHLGLCNMSDNH